MLDFQRRIFVAARLQCPGVFRSIRQSSNGESMTQNFFSSLNHVSENEVHTLLDLHGFRKSLACQTTICFKSIYHKVHTSFIFWCFRTSSGAITNVNEFTLHPSLNQIVSLQNQADATKSEWHWGWINMLKH